MKGRVTHFSLLSQKLEMNRGSKEDMSKAEIGQMVRLSSQTDGHIVNIKENNLKGIKIATSVTTQMVRK